MWQNDLFRMLLWSLKYSVANYTRSHPSAVPSWSWASIVQYEDPNTRGDNSPNYLLVQGSYTSFKQDTNAKIIKVESTAHGINPFGQVSAGTNFICGTVAHLTLVRRRPLSHVGFDDRLTHINLHWDNSLEIAAYGYEYSVEDVRDAPEICVGTDMVFEQEEDKFIVITRQSLILDIWLGEEEEILDGDSVLCLLSGTNEIQWF